MHHRIPAVVLLSGGIDSSTVLALANEAGYSTHVLTFDYGQTHRIEIEYAKQVVEHLGAESHTVLNLDFGFSDTPLLDGSAPQYANRAEIPGGQSEAFMPGRNAVFLAHGLAFAEQLGARDLFIGPNADDAAGFADCRPMFIKAFERVASLSTNSPFHLHAPLIEMSKAQIVARGRELGIDYPRWTWSCYRPAGGVDPCGLCEACLARTEALLA